MRRLALMGLALFGLCVMFAAALALTGRAVVGQALAAESLEFKTVPPESARAFERARTLRKRDAVAPVPAAPSAPPVPAVPEVPDVPSPIEVNLRSGDMMRIGQDIHIESNQTVTGDVVAMGGDIVVDGHVEGDVQAMGGDVYLNAGARVDGDVFCMGGQLREQPGAQVGGQRVTALGPKDRHWERKMLHLRDRSDGEPLTSARPFRKVFGALLWIILTSGLAWGFFKLAPGRSGAALDGLRHAAGPSLLTGLLVALVWAPGFIAVALLAAILCITLIGIPVAIVLLLAYPSIVALMWIWGFAIGAAAIGQRVNAARGLAAPPLATSAAVGAVTLGGALLVGTLLKQIPSFGLLEGLGTLIKVLTWITLIVVSTLGAGALVRHEFAQGPLRRWWTGRQNGKGAQAPAVPTPTGTTVSSDPASAAPLAPPPAPPTTPMPPSGAEEPPPSAG